MNMNFMSCLHRSIQRDKNIFIQLLVALSLTIAASANAEAAALLALHATIPLPHTSGRIDHLDIDLARRRLFVAELGNGSVDVIDLASHTVIKRITGLEEPQGVVFAPKADVLAVDGGGDGTVRFYSGKNYVPRAVVRLGDDADDARLDPASGNIVVAYGTGGLAVIDPSSEVVVRRIPLPAHPEGFQLDGDHVFVNEPDAGQIDEVDLNTGQRIATWKPQGLAANFPLGLGIDHMVGVGFRSPNVFALFDATNGHLISRIDNCGDADDLYFDAERKRYYASCGSGQIDIFTLTGGSLHQLGYVKTSWGARTSLFVPQLDRLFLAVRAAVVFGHASIRIYRPLP